MSTAVTTADTHNLINVPLSGEHHKDKHILNIDSPVVVFFLIEQNDPHFSTVFSCDVTNTISSVF